jgi:transcriptional regulator with XRE-family HTH domain
VGLGNFGEWSPTSPKLCRGATVSAHAVSIRVNSRLKTYKIRRDPTAWQGPFVDFVVRYGIQKLAKQLDVRLCTVYQWINGQWSPTRDKAKQIARIALESGVILTTDDVLDHREQVRVRAEHVNSALVKAQQSQAAAAPKEEQCPQLRP